MANQFYVGQRVRSEKYGEGEVLNVSSNRHPGFPVYCSFKNSGMGYSLAGVLIGGSDIDLTPIDPPRTVMTDWQRKQIEQFRNGTNDQVVIQMDKLISILSEPEPPKFKPKEGEAVLVKQDVDNFWLPRVFTKMFAERYQCYALMDTDRCNWKFCRPFDAALVGQITND
mgnify:CR=1 FL=1